MKESPDNQKLEQLLRSSKLVAGGFMGSDTRTFSEVTDADSAELARLGFTNATNHEACHKGIGNLGSDR
jgi:hypothetical protein